jgi:DUF971 family protein
VRPPRPRTLGDALRVIEELLLADREIHVTWADGHRPVVLANLTLRERCPCAQCVDETTGRRILDPRRIPRDIRADAIRLVGRYAIQVNWSDRHSTGIYPFSRLFPGGESGTTTEKRRYEGPLC